MPTETVYFRYRVSIGSVHTICSDGFHLDQCVRDLLQRGVVFTAIGIEVIFGVATVA